jgi:hypothetical protein
MSEYDGIYRLYTPHWKKLGRILPKCFSHIQNNIEPFSIDFLPDFVLELIWTSATSGGRVDESVRHGARGRPVDVPVPMKKHCRLLSDMMR